VRNTLIGSRAAIVIATLVNIVVGAGAFNGSANGAAAVANYNLTATTAGTGSGTVFSDTGLSCSATCSVSVPEGTIITLTATASTGNQFTGWLGPCSGTGTCQFTIGGPTTVVATFASPPISGKPLDIDGDSTTDALTDGLLAIRYMFGLSNTALIDAAVAPSATRKTAQQIGDRLADLSPMLDIDGNGRIDALTDGVMIIRYLSGLRDTALVSGAVGPGSIRTSGAAIQTQTANLTLPSSFPSNPIPGANYVKQAPFTLNDGTTTSYIYVPSSYDTSHNTPTKLFVWLHGCGGLASNDIFNVSPGGTQTWISLALGGQEGGCWDVGTDPARVMTAVAYMKTRFNIDPGRVILGGYSSGGDLAYRTIFYNSPTFAGCLIENSSPFRDTGSTQTQSFAAVDNGGWKFHVVHLAHLQDATYPIAGVRTETNAMISAGFPLSRVEVDGGHYDDPGAIENGHPVPGTVADLISILLPHIDDGWVGPAGTL
jgi:predicted esterase